MVRQPRLVVPGYPHHIIQRGNRRMAVFFSDEDRQVYVNYIQQACQHREVDIWAWCMMTNHVHFIAVPGRQTSLARCFSEAHIKYTRRINKREGWVGHLWQSRFGSSVLDERHLIAAVRYVERNPVRAGLVQEPWDQPWSSARRHTGKEKTDPLIRNDSALKNLIGDWKCYLQDADENKFVEKIRR